MLTATGIPARAAIVWPQAFAPWDAQQQPRLILEAQQGLVRAGATYLIGLGRRRPEAVAGRDRPS